MLFYSLYGSFFFFFFFQAEDGIRDLYVTGVQTCALPILGGMEVGSVWGHGSYVAPDWTADWLHREATFILDRWSKADFGTEYAQLDGERQAQLQGRLAKVMRTNTYD